MVHTGFIEDIGDCRKNRFLCLPPFVVVSPIKLNNHWLVEKHLLLLATDIEKAVRCAVMQPKFVFGLNFFCLLVAIPKPDDLELDEAGILVGQN